MTQNLSVPQFKTAFEGRINTWESKLHMTRDVLKEWLMCQSSWLNLKPAFSSDEINRQLPVEARTFKKMDGIWRRLMKTAFDNRKVMELCPDAVLFAKLRLCNKLLGQVQKGFSDYLATSGGSIPTL
ncbi:dynein heavy chain 1, axonemal-like [Salarias fasciatus]|nr:dynein heavy chain 1, axonemal-like [Salarias fasciatus]